MKKIGLRLLSSALSLATLLTVAPVKGFSDAYAKTNNSPTSGKSSGKKWPWFLGGGALVAGVVVAGVLISKNFPKGSDSASDSASESYTGSYNSAGGAVPTNGKEATINPDKLCFWDGFMQKLHGSKQFRDFISGSSLKSLGDSASKNLEEFRKLFAEMDKGVKVDRERFYSLAHKILPKDAVARAEKTKRAGELIASQDVNAILEEFMPSIAEEYKKFKEVLEPQLPKSTKQTNAVPKDAGRSSSGQPAQSGSAPVAPPSDDPKKSVPSGNSTGGSVSKTQVKVPDEKSSNAESSQDNSDTSAVKPVAPVVASSADSNTVVPSSTSKKRSDTPLEEEVKVPEEPSFCYGFVRKLYELTDFREFFKNINLDNVSDPNTKRKLSKFREIFKKFNVQKQVSEGLCKELVDSVITNEELRGDFYSQKYDETIDIDATLNAFVNDVYVEYERFKRSPQQVQPEAKEQVVIVPGATSSDDAGSKRKSTVATKTTTSSSTAVPNANLTNTKNLCFFHALVQQLYSIKSFRKFVDDTSIDSSDDVGKKRTAFREFFKKMDEGGLIGAEDCLNFACRILSGYKNDGGDICEAWTDGMKAIDDAYKKYCGNFIVDRLAVSNIFETPFPIGCEGDSVTLESLLRQKVELSNDDKMQKVQGLLFEKTTKQQIITAYISFYDKEKTCVSLEDGKLKFQEFDERRYPAIARLKKCFDENLEFINTTDGQDGLKELLMNCIDDGFVSTVGCIQESFKEGSKNLGYREVIPVRDGQFALFVSRQLPDGRGGMFRCEKKIDFGDGTVMYKKKKYELTAVTVHYSNHYYTYKKQDGHWYLYNDRQFVRDEGLFDGKVSNPGCAHEVSFENMKLGVTDDGVDPVSTEQNCTMLTFSEKTN